MSTLDWGSKPLNFLGRRRGWGKVIKDRVGHASLRSKAIREDEHHRRESRPYIAAMAKAAYEQRISLFTSAELDNEQMRQKTGLTGLDVDVFQIVDFKIARAPAKRSFAVTSRPRDIQNASDRCKNEQLDFFASIAIPRYLELRKQLGDAHLADIFHYWTAEANGLDGFVTMETRFPNAFNRQAKRFAPKSRALSPVDVCKLHGLEPVDVDENIKTKLSGMDVFAHTPVLAYAALGLD
ncbi:MAG: hypothetical protein RH982_05360 [Parvibaculum sp.]